MSLTASKLIVPVGAPSGGEQQVETKDILTPLLEDTTINLLKTDSTAEKQAKIDAVPRSAIPRVTATFQFEDGTHTETDTLTFEGFTYPIIIQGNDSDSASLNTSQSVIINSSSHSTDGIAVLYCSQVRISKLRVLSSDNNGTEGVSIIGVPSSIVEFCSFLGAGKTNNASCIKLTDSIGYVYLCYVSNTNYGIRCNRSFIQSNTNDDTGTAPNYGLYSDGTLMKTGASQPSGSTSNELTANGGVIR